MQRKKARAKPKAKRPSRRRRSPLPPRENGKDGPYRARPIVLGHTRAPSLGAIARAVGMTTAAVSLIFAGKRQPSVRTAEKIAGYFGVSVDRFLAYLSVLTGASVVLLPREGSPEEPGRA